MLYALFFFLPNTNFYLLILTKVVHNLAKLSIKFSNCVVLMKDVPSPIYHVLQADIANLV